MTTASVPGHLLRGALAALTVVLLLAGASSAGAEGEMCAPPSGPVSIIILQSGEKVYELARSLARGSKVVAKDTTTVVFDDGRVITADVDRAGQHLNTLGWGARRIRVVATLPARRPRPRRSGG
jgi:hypothetical protein